ncbi:MAG: AI-2E family transporter [Actinobacteria bacterium]|nr:AI-2E family transporter [Actinomycetota bacterium]
METEKVTSSPETNPVIRLLLVGASITLILVGLRLAASILTTFFLAFVIAVSMNPIMAWLKRRGLPQWLAFSIVVLMVLFFMIFVAVVVFVSVQQLTTTLPTYQENIAEMKQSLVDWLNSKGIDLSSVGSLDSFDPHNMVNFFITMLREVSAAISGWMFILFVAAMMLIESTSHPAKLLRAVREGSPMPQRLIDFNRDIRSYLAINAWLGFAVAAMNTVFLLILGVDFALLWGILSFIFSFIPYIGFVVSFVPPTIMALLEFGLGKAILVAAGFIVINTVVDSIINPRIMSRGLNLSALMVILSVLFWSWVMGPLGAILAVPLTLAVKKLVLESSDESRWLAVLMEPENLEPEKT